MIQIDKNVPPPKERRNWKKQLSHLDVNDSFSFAKTDRPKVANAVSIHFHSCTDRKFTISDDPMNPDKARVWRTE